MNRALWRYGRSNQAAQQAAVMVYVHRLMGDGAPGEADPKALSAASQRVYKRVVRDAERFAGPYKIRAELADKLVEGKAAAVTVEVLTASGRRVPDVDVSLALKGADGASREAAHGLERAREDDADTPRRRGRRDAGGDRRRAAGRPAGALRAHARPVRAQRAAAGAGGDREAERAGQGPGAGPACAVDPDQLAGRRHPVRRSPTRSGSPGSAPRARRSRPRSTVPTALVTRSPAPTLRSGPAPCRPRATATM